MRAPGRRDVLVLFLAVLLTASAGPAGAAGTAGDVTRRPVVGGEPAAPVLTVPVPTSSTAGPQGPGGPVAAQDPGGAPTIRLSRAEVLLIAVVRAAGYVVLAAVGFAAGVVPGMVVVFIGVAEVVTLTYLADIGCALTAETGFLRGRASVSGCDWPITV